MPSCMGSSTASISGWASDLHSIGLMMRAPWEKKILAQTLPPDCREGRSLPQRIFLQNATHCIPQQIHAGTEMIENTLLYSGVAAFLSAYLADHPGLGSSVFYQVGLLEVVGHFKLEPKLALS